MDNKKINILVIPSDKTGCGFFRSYQPHLYLKENYSDLFNIDILYDEETHEVPWYKELFSKYDIVHIHKKLDDGCILANIIKSCGCKLIVDIDDYWNLGNDHPMSVTAKYEKWHIPIINHIKLADCVTTTTSIFEKEIKKYNKNTFVLPNCIDKNDKRFSLNNNSSKRLRFGIVCGSSHLKDIELLTGISSQLSKDVLDKIQFSLCGFDTTGTKTLINLNTNEKKVVKISPEESVWCRYEEILTNNYSIIDDDYKKFLKLYARDSSYDGDVPYKRYWTKDMDNYYKHYENIDVLLVPLKENDFNKMKSQLKVVEAGFGHKAIIAQNFGPYTIDLVSMIEKGGKINENGNALLVDSAKNHKQWAKYITKLATDKDMLEKLKDNLYNTVKDKYSLETVSKDRVKLYLNIVNN